MEGAATRNLYWYTTLRLTAIIPGVIIPALVSLNIAGAGTMYIHGIGTVAKTVLSETGFSRPRSPMVDGVPTPARRRA
jgi:hypothetical protein